MITFTEQPSKDIENLYNNQVFEFNEVGGIECELQISNGINIRQIVVDGINGYFYIEASRAIQSLFNIDNFEDNKLPTQISYLINDASLFREYTFDFNIKKGDGSIVSDQIIKKYFKSVGQITDQIEVENTIFKSLSNNKYFNYYEGLPFDISFYSNTNRSITILNKKTGISGLLNFTVGVNRLFFSNGENINGFESLVPLVIGEINQLEFYDGITLLETIEVYKHKECEAPYIKWFNTKGGWSYFRFSRIYQKVRNTRNLDLLSSDFSNLEKSKGNFKTLGKLAGESLIMKSDDLQEIEQDNFLDIFVSPKVYYYNTKANQPMTAFSFKEVAIANETSQTINTKRKVRSFNVVIDLPSSYTQTAL